MSDWTAAAVLIISAYGAGFWFIYKVLTWKGPTNKDD